MLCTAAARDLSATSLERRREIAAGSCDLAAHEAATASLPAFRAVEVRSREASRTCPGAARVVAWNAERGGHPTASAAMLAPLEADALLLSELDVGMARSAQVHAARALADALGCGYAYGLEFLELGLGGARERETHAGKENRIGHHGGAVLSPHTLERPALVRLDAGGDWFDRRRGERRVGGRIAVLATLRLGETPVALASVHLESHAGPAHRDRQMEALLAALDAYAPGAPALIGGDVNTHGLSLEALEDREVLAKELREDPTRLRNPVPHEPLFERLAAAGFDFRSCNLEAESTERRKSPSERGSLKLDWLFARGLRCSDPEVIAAVDPEGGAPLSDHEALAVTIEPR